MAIGIIDITVLKSQILKKGRTYHDIVIEMTKKGYHCSDTKFNVLNEMMFALTIKFFEKTKFITLRVITLRVDAHLNVIQRLM